jgi:excinuclease ABC subunit C
MALTDGIIASLPRATGVYLLRDSSRRIIYIGKAKDLRARLRSYLSGDDRPFTPRIVQETQQADYILTHTEAEALLLENQLIKTHRPRYNIDLKDDKSYVRIRVTTHQEWPAISITRAVVDDGSSYFGPYSSAQATRRTLSAIGRIFPVRRCKDTEFANRSRPCMYHSIGLCLAPCVFPGVKPEYDQAVKDLVAFLEGRNRDLERLLEERMRYESDLLNFEHAARIRDQIAAIRTTLLPQVVVGHTGGDCHVFASFRDQDRIQVAVMEMSGGTLLDSRNLTVRHAGDEDLSGAVILQFYLGGTPVPGCIYTDPLPQDRSLLEHVLGGMRGSRVRIVRPTRGTPLRWLSMAMENARTHARAGQGSVLEDIAKAFRLSSIPYRMECYDISTFQGEASGASRVVFTGGEPDKALYRHYRIRTVEGQDDFAMLREVFTRRLLKDESRPDLIVIDGGKGQLSVFVRVLDELGITGIPLVAMAKARREGHDRFFLPGRKDAVRLSERSAALRTLQRLRDEAHRFAVKYHRHLRSRGKSAPFHDIPGIGAKKARALLRHTAHLQDLSRITEEDLRGCPLLSARDRKAVVSFLSQDEVIASHSRDTDL